VDQTRSSHPKERKKQKPKRNKHINFEKYRIRDFPTNKIPRRNKKIRKPTQLKKALSRKDQGYLKFS
jgi:hypothetical protein